MRAKLKHTDEMKPIVKVIKSKSAIGEYTVHFTIGVQGFTLQNLGEEKRAKWYAKMLRIAFKNLLAIDKTTIQNAS